MAHGGHKPIHLTQHTVGKPSLDDCVGDGTSAQIDMIAATAPHIFAWKPWEQDLNPVVHKASGKGEA